MLVACLVLCASVGATARSFSGFARLGCLATVVGFTGLSMRLGLARAIEPFLIAPKCYLIDPASWLPCLAQKSDGRSPVCCGVRRGDGCTSISYDTAGAPSRCTVFSSCLLPAFNKALSVLGGGCGFGSPAVVLPQTGRPVCLAQVGPLHFPLWPLGVECWFALVYCGVHFGVSVAVVCRCTLPGLYWHGAFGGGAILLPY